MQADASIPLAELVRAYDTGVLTPFTGAGISTPLCPLWRGFVEDIERVANVRARTGTSTFDFIRRASAAVRVLRNRDADALADAVRRSMYQHRSKKTCTLPRQLEALAQIWWPLVLTTNYESIFLDEWNRIHVHAREDPLPEFTEMVVLGRGRAHCQQVLNSTRRPDNPILWALQGFVEADRPCDLSDQLAVGHEEYRRQTHESVHFRRAFAEIYRSRVLLFIGSGLTETYLLDLFGEALELMGAVDHFHFALVEKGTTDRDFLFRRLQIRAIEYQPGAEGDRSGPVSGFLERLKAAIDGPRPRTASWGMKLDSKNRQDAADLRPDITIARGPLYAPEAVPPGTAAALSVGIRAIAAGSWQLLGGHASGWLAGRDLDFADFKRVRKTHIWRSPDRSVYLVAARDPDRSGSDARDTRHLATAVSELMACAAADRHPSVSAMLLAAGKSRTFPQYISLLEMVRGYARWFKTAKRKVALTIHVVDPSVTSLLDSGRIDPVSAASPMSLQFWVEIGRDGQREAPVPDFGLAQERVAAVAERHAIMGEHWRVGVRPSPTKNQAPMLVTTLRSDGPTLEDFGVTDGATLVFTKVTPSVGAAGDAATADVM